MNEHEVQWQVTWFPADRPDAHKTYVEEGTARARFAAEIEQGTSPILSKRDILTTPWETVENSVTP
jgi:hypothetical protein